MLCKYALSRFIYYSAECHCAECRYAECRGAIQGPVLKKHYGLVIYGFRTKLTCLSKPTEVTNNSNKTVAYVLKICPFSVHYKSVIFYSTYPGPIEMCWVVSLPFLQRLD